MSDEVENYIRSAPASRRERLDMLHDMIIGLYPRVVVDMSYKMPTYRAAEGWVAIANQKNYLSLYTCSYHHIGAFRDKHPKIKTGKGCINFRDSDAFPVKDIKQVIKHAFSHPKSADPR